MLGDGNLIKQAALVLNIPTQSKTKLSKTKWTEAKRSPPLQNQKPNQTEKSNQTYHKQLREYFQKQLTGLSPFRLSGSEFWELQKIVLNKEVLLLNQILSIHLPD